MSEVAWPGRSSACLCQGSVLSLRGNGSSCPNLYPLVGADVGRSGGTKRRFATPLQRYPIYATMEGSPGRAGGILARGSASTSWCMLFWRPDAGRGGGRWARVVRKGVSEHGTAGRLLRRGPDCRPPPLFPFLWPTLPYAGAGRDRGAGPRRTYRVANEARRLRYAPGGNLSPHPHGLPG